MSPESSNFRARLLIADDHASVRDGLRCVLADEPDFEIVGEAYSVATTLHAIEGCAPDILVLDFGLGAENAERVLAELAGRANAPRVLMLSMEDERVVGQELLRRGAAAYVSKTAPTSQIILALSSIRRTLLEERSVVGPGASGGAPNPAVSLTKREREILLLMKTGLPSKSIATRLKISEKTVDVYKHQLRRKLKLHTQLELVRHATLFVG
jgi:DNA-binding NarL/FixJ family response regulator